MPKRTDIRRILIIGAGPIVIGQACEFDYSGSQACRALKQEGYEVILINSNPATIMTDPDMADQTYVEPITPEMVTRIIEKERPDAILPTMGGQTSLNIAFQLHEQGVLEKYGVELIGANFAAIQAAEERSAFKKLTQRIGLDALKSETVSNMDEARKAAQEIGFPLVLRPAFTLGGSGGAIAYHPDEFEALIENALAQSPIDQVLLEESALGWKEYEFEVMRDSHDNVVIVCSVENVDPMGIHTGDSITVAPAQTLSDKEYHILRNASIDIIRAVGVDAGGCNIQFAVHPKTGRVIVIEMNPRVSRSSALVSKATGVPIAKISAKLAVGLTLDEIQNDITQTTPASFEPVIDYVVTKIPRFSFEKFPGTKDWLSPQMKSVGEVMAIGRTFQESFQKALRGLEIGLDGFSFPEDKVNTTELQERLRTPSHDRIRWIYQALHQGLPIETIYDLTGIDPWFLENWLELITTEKALWHTPLSNIPASLLKWAKAQGFSNGQILKRLAPSPTLKSQLEHRLAELDIKPVFNAVDTCAGEFEAFTPYYYSTHWGTENEVTLSDAGKKRVVIIGGGPNRIGQGIEFDYCCVHAAFSLQKLGYEAIMVNSNPETVSTDYDISNRLYFEPLTPENVLPILALEQPHGVIVQLGGQTPLKLAHAIEQAGYPILGTSVHSIDLAEDREQFSSLLKRLNLRSPESGTARSMDEALSIAADIGYPLIVRPSYILGGRAMKILYSEKSLRKYLTEVIHVEPDYPVLIERFLEDAREYDVDALCDGTHTYIGGILEHIEHAGVHSGDSWCVWPAQRISETLNQDIIETTALLARELNVQGLLNIQFASKGNDLYVLEVNPRASRTVPFICKATGTPMIQVATRLMLGESLGDCTDQLPPQPQDHVAVKAPVFPFDKFRGSDPQLGPEMKSTGEVMGIDSTFSAAMAKATLSVLKGIPLTGKVFISVKDADKAEALEVAAKFVQLGFRMVATEGTSKYLEQNGFDIETIRKKHEGSPNAQELIEQGEIQLIINTPIGEDALHDDSYIRKSAIEHRIPMITTMAGAHAMTEAISSMQRQQFEPRSLQSYLPGLALSHQESAVP